MVTLATTWIDRQFPNAIGKYTIKSSPTEDYNCIAWAAGEDSEWWSHLPGYRWPAPRSPLIGSLVAVFSSLGYEQCASSAIESGYEKIALYVKLGMWTHAARQLKSGKWTSKLGPDEDCEHDNPEAFCGDSYAIHCIMRRRTGK